MKKQILFCVFLLFLFNKLEAQEFSFQMYFEDAEGNKDTLTIGFDFYGSRDTINPDFGEENIVDVPFDDVFDVRISNQATINAYGYFYDYDLYHSKKKILKYACEYDFIWGEILPVADIDIHALNWPVTATWNSDLFNNECISGSLFTALWHGDWWDTGHIYSNFTKVILNQENEVTFTPNYPENDAYLNKEWEPNYYVDDSGKIISTFWTAFADSTMLHLNNSVISNKEIINIYPNPTKGIITISTTNQLTEIKQIEILDLSGRIHLATFSDLYIDLSELKNGLYIIKITLKNGKVYFKKVIKTT